MRWLPVHPLAGVVVDCNMRGGPKVGGHHSLMVSQKVILTMAKQKL